MTQWEIQVKKKHHGGPFPGGLISGEGAFPEEPLTPASSFLDLPSDLPTAGHREFLRKRRLLAKVLQHLQASGLPGQEQAQTFLVHLCRRNCRPNTLRAYADTIQLFLTFLRHRGKARLKTLTRGDPGGLVGAGAGPGFEGHLRKIPLGLGEGLGVEHIWVEIREKWFTNEVIDSLEAVEDRLVEALVALETEKDLVASTTGFDWIVNCL